MPTALLSEPGRIPGLLSFLLGFFATIYGWSRHTHRHSGFLQFLNLLVYQRGLLLRAFFQDGPGYLMLPLWLIVARAVEMVWPLLVAG